MMVMAFLSAVPSAGLHWIFRMMQILIAMAVSYLAYLVIRRGWLVSVEVAYERLKLLRSVSYILQYPHVTWPRHFFSLRSVQFIRDVHLVYSLAVGSR